MVFAVVAARPAMRTGWHGYVGSTDVPSSIRVVARPTSVMGISGSPATAPAYQSEEKPSASACVACSTMRSTVLPPPLNPMRTCAPCPRPPETLQNREAGGERPRGDRPMTATVDVDALRSAAQREIDRGLVACQVAVARDGDVVWTETFGAADASSRFMVASATKPIVASAVWQFLADGSLELDAPGGRLRARVRRERQGCGDGRAGAPDDVRVPDRGDDPPRRASIPDVGSSGSRRGSSSTSPARSTCTTPRRRTGCSPS